MANAGNQAQAVDQGVTGTSITPVQLSGSCTVIGTISPPGESSASEGHASEGPSESQSIAGDSHQSESNHDSEESDGPDSTDQTRWNRIIPELSRTVPVGNVVVRRPGRARQALSTPATGQVTGPQRAWRIWAIRQHLGEPVGITDAEIGSALVASRWDLGTALRRMNDVLNQARHRHRTNAPNRSPAEQQRDRLLGADSLHHNRRLGIDFIYTRLVQVVRVDQVNLLTTLALGQVLADHRFDIDEAVNAFLERLKYSEQVEQHQRMERRLRMINPTQLHQDQRIARLMEIAGTDDYYAARGLLMMHGYDMLRAMDHWMRHGLAAQPIPPSEPSRTFFRSPRRPHTDTEDLWPHPRPIAGRLDDIDEDDLADADADYGDPSYPDRKGWLVRYPRQEARVGVNVPTRRRIDYIRLGQFRVIQIDDVGREENDTGPRDPFDYNNSNHIKHLNNEASQWYRRVPGETSKVKGTEYQADENEWIWWWHNERFWELVEAHPELLNANTAADWLQAGVRWPMRTDIQRLTRDFNHRWTQQIHLPGMNGVPRSARDRRSLDAQRRRVLAICDDFAFPYSPAHPKKGDRGSTPPEPPRFSSSDSSNDDPGDDDDDEPKPPKAKVKRSPKDIGKGNKGDQKAEEAVDEDADEEELQRGDDEVDSANEQPAKKPKHSTEKGGTGKRKRGEEDDDSDYGAPKPRSPGPNRGGGRYRSGRNQGRE